MKKRYFLISYIGKNKLDEVTYGTTEYVSEGFINRQTFILEMEREGIFRTTILNMHEMTEEDYNQFTHTHTLIA